MEIRKSTINSNEVPDKNGSVIPDSKANGSPFLVSVTSPQPGRKAMSEIFLTVVIPAYNEARRLPDSLTKVLQFLEAQNYASEIIVVDDGSTDATSQAVEKLLTERMGKATAANQLDQAELSQVQECQFKLIQNEHRGKGYAVRSGMLQGRGKYILFSDADLSTPIEEAEKLLFWLDQGFDVAVGSREGQGARRYDEPFYRHLMGRVFNLLVRTVTRSQLQDTQCGFKAFTRTASHDLFRRVQLYGEQSGIVKGAMVTGFDVEVLFLAQKKGYRIKEVPVRWYHVGESKVNPVRDSLRMIRDIVKVRLNDLGGHYKSSEQD